jgi:hypothetical protein
MLQGKDSLLRIGRGRGWVRQEGERRGNQWDLTGDMETAVHLGSDQTPIGRDTHNNSLRIRANICWCPIALSLHVQGLSTPD